MIKALSPAKINFHLTVLRKRPDGYHDIFSLMQRISLYDSLSFCPREKDILISCPDSALPVNEDNIVSRAARALFAKAGYRGGVEIEIKKNIPIAAGLGGGSSNAAITLVTLNDLFDFRLTKEELLNLGMALGADVPFFIFGKTAWASGIGEVLTEARNIPQGWFVLINPGFPVSTRKIYAGLNLGLTSEPIKYSIPPLHGQDDLIRFLKNDLEGITSELHPEIRQMKDLMRSAEAPGNLMSGSGPTVFGFFREEQEARAAASSISAVMPAEWRVFVAHSI
ncbi:MAG: 4-(cytidine 5'-diphospho)-2-C-methyl-D-erythritol kinase [Smithellaceae bacterium]|nr:4-(cytidine 5'-diphospho)-2-C-methyl-D-erythritol kinase [Smithellaceae bacterium]